MMEPESEPWHLGSRVCMLCHFSLPLLSAGNWLFPTSILLVPSHCCCHRFRFLRSFLRCHLLKGAFPSCSVKTRAHTGMHTPHHSLFPLPFFVFSLSSYYHLPLIYLYVCPLRAVTLFCSLLYHLDQEHCPAHSSTR